MLRRHDDAVRHFSTCIRLEPSNEIYYSNRAAAHTALKNYRGALSDGKEVVRLKPRWAKGWARIAAAHFGLEEFQEVCMAHSPEYQRSWDITCNAHFSCMAHRLLCCISMEGSIKAATILLGACRLGKHMRRRWSWNQMTRGCRKHGIGLMSQNTKPWRCTGTSSRDESQKMLACISQVQPRSFSKPQ